MAAYEYAGNVIPAPSLNINTPTTTDQELKQSTVGYSQRGGQLAGGQGILQLGTVLARDSVTKLWVKWVSGGPNGTGIASGVLRKTTDTGANAITTGSGYYANIAFRGTLKLNFVSSAMGSNTAAAATALGARTNAVLNQFTF